MPAVELGRLQQQVTQLSDLFTEPASYLRGVEDLLKDHSGQVHRLGRIKGLRSTLRTYEVPPPLLKLLALEMSNQAKSHTQEALAIADGLWAKEMLETRQLAVQLLGSIPTSTAIDITSRLERWARENHEQLLVQEIAASGSKTLRATHQEMLLVFTTKLLNTSDSRKQILAFGILQNLVLDNHFPNFPELFGLLSDPCKKPNRATRPELANLLIILARRSPKETEFFLLGILQGMPNEDTRWLVRQAAKVLPEESRLRIRAAESRV
jgi:hypothetical protein